MSVDTSSVYLSAIDEERFGIRTARISDLTLETLSFIMDYCRDHDVRLLIARCQTSENQVAQALEREGAFLTDTLLYYKRSLTRIPIPEDIRSNFVCPLQPGEEEAVEKIAAEAFKGYLGHYHMDRRLERQKCDDAYQSWARHSCVSREVADEVLVAKSNRDIIGFATLKINSLTEGEGVLFGVSPDAVGRGVYWSLMTAGMRWFHAKGMRLMAVSTQINNIAVQKTWVRLGFEPSRSYYTFHKWFDET